ncbi:MAG: TRAP transporter small permease subunit [Dehalococcoidia bacterium]|nr:TRAP transporter small permease subunit [Dehalococcoidia bacterium]
MKKAIHLIDRVTDWTGRYLVLVLLPLIGVALYEVIARFMFNKPTVWAHETTSLIFGAYVVLLGAYTLLVKQHVRVDILWARLSERGKAIADLATSGFSFLFTGALFWYATEKAIHSIATHETSVTVFGPPLYPSRAILAIGSLMLLLQLVSKFYHDLEITRAINGQSTESPREEA